MKLNYLHTEVYPTICSNTEYETAAQEIKCYSQLRHQTYLFCVWRLTISRSNKSCAGLLAFLIVHFLRKQPVLYSFIQKKSLLFTYLFIFIYLGNLSKQTDIATDILFSILDLSQKFFGTLERNFVSMAVGLV